tara:strand:- start:1133 stop:1687 length:555 start_codon:yes stop_codon:yes gene_type:complete
MSDFIYQFNIDKSICNELIKHHIDSNKKSPGCVTGGIVNKDLKDSIDLSIYPNNELSFVKKYYKELEKGLYQYLDIHNILKEKISLHTKESFIIQHYYPKGGFKTWHFERSDVKEPMISRTLVFMTYLNDVTDQGETEWYYQKLKIKPLKGLSVIWPADWTHTHRGIPSPTQEKYIATGWFNMI